MSDRPNLLPARMNAIETVRTATGGGFDAEAWRVMDRRDEALIRDEIMNGAGSSKFVYNFKVSGKMVSGVSVIGARQLAYHYQGIRHRLIASVEKIGPLFTFTSFPQPGMAMAVSAQVIHELEREDDFYQVLVEIEDIKTGNIVQVEKREQRLGKRDDGSNFERPHYSVIAQSKAYRNGVLALIPQDVQLRWKIEMLKLGKDEEITDDVLSEKRAGILRFAAAKAIPLMRDAVNELTMDQIAGLADAARTGNAPAFAQSCVALGLADGEVHTEAEGSAEAPKSTPKPSTAPRKPRETTAAPQTQSGDPGPQDEHGEAPTPSPTRQTRPAATEGGAGGLFDE